MNTTTGTASLNEQLEKHDMFQQDYRQVVLLLQDQQALASLHESTSRPRMHGTQTSKRCQTSHWQHSLKHVFQDKENQSESRGIPEAPAFLLSSKGNKNKKRSSNPATDDNKWVVNLQLQQDVNAFRLDETHEFSQAHLKEKVSLPTLWYTSGECEPGSERMLGFLLSYPCPTVRLRRLPVSRLVH
jgi:hypothetical protein